MTFPRHSRPTSSVRAARRGFSLVELLAAMAIAGILGVAITRMLMTESRLFNIQQARREARAVGRNSTNVLLSDLRMVNDGASAPGSVLIAVRDTLKVRVPYAFGLACGTVSGVTTASMFAADSSVRYMATYAGWAWRSLATGVYTYKPASSSSDLPVVSAAPATCTATAQIRVDTIVGRSWPPIDLRPSSSNVQAGWPVFVYQEVTYFFGASSAVPGRIGLWRRVGNGTPEELVAPFDATARFKFFTRGIDTPSTTPPTPLDSLVGVAIVLNGSSTTGTIARNTIRTNMETSVFFRNRKTN